MVEEVYMRRFGELVLAVAAAACGSGSGGGGSSGPNTIDGVTVMDGFSPGPAPAPGTGFQIVLPIVHDIQVGGSYEYCSWSNVILKQDAWIKESEGWQTQSGHHVIVYYTMNPIAAGTNRLCTDSDMAGFRFAVGAAGEGIDQVQLLPGDLAVHIPAGAQIVINHHYLNAGTKDLPEAQSAVNIIFPPAGAKITQASSVALADSEMQILPGKQ